MTFIDGHFEPGLYPSVVDLVVPINDKARKRICAQNMIIREFMLSADQVKPKNYSFT